jgi:hemerythrin-like domain-containing protein
MLLVNLGRACQTALDRAQGLFATIRRELDIHAQLEQKLLYPALKPVARVRVEQALEDHRTIGSLLAQMQAHSLQDPEFSTWVWDLAENVEHHIELEENELFSIAQDRLSAPVLEELEQEMRNLRAALTRAALAGR